MNMGSLLSSTFSPGFAEVAKLLSTGRGTIHFPSLSHLVPYTMDGPFKQSMNFFMRLAWSSKVQLPILIAVCFMAFDIRLQLEINIFWEPNHRAPPPPPPPQPQIVHLNHHNSHNNYSALALGAGLHAEELFSDLDLDDDESFSEDEEEDGEGNDSDDNVSTDERGEPLDFINSMNDITLCVSESFESDPEDGSR